MWQLFLDASTAKPFILLSKDYELQCFKEMDAKGSTSLIHGLEEIFQNFPLAPRQIEKIYVGSGPGSFIGLRSSMTIAKMFKASFQTKIEMVPVMQAISLPENGKIVSLIDGKSRGIFIAIHEKTDGQTLFIQEPQLQTIEELQSLKNEALCSFENEVLMEKTSFKIKKATWDPNILLQLMCSDQLHQAFCY